MSDPTISKIDNFFDFIDRGVDAADRVLNRGQQTADQHKARKAKREIIDVTSEPTPPKKAPSSTSSTSSKSTAVARRPHFYIAESIDPKSGSTIYVVTDGGNARTECSTREFAAQILRALEATP